MGTAAREERIEAPLRRAAGCREWEIVVSCDEERLANAVAEREIALPGAASAALSYILEMDAPRDAESDER